MQRMRSVRGGAAVNRCVSVSSLKLLNNLQLFSIEFCGPGEGALSVCERSLQIWAGDDIWLM